MRLVAARIISISRRYFFSFDVPKLTPICVKGRAAPQEANMGTLQTVTLVAALR